MRATWSTATQESHPVLPSDDYDLPLPDPAEHVWHNATRAVAFRRGLTVVLSTAGIILFASAAGYGALARDAGFSLTNSVYMMGIFFALPAQVVLLDQVSRGASLMAGALAVSLTGLRLLPMSVVIMPLLKGPNSSRWRYLIAAHYVAVTAWIEGWRRLPHVPVHLRMDHYLGIGTGLLSATLIGTVAGFEIAGTVHPVIAAALLFLTPIYFLLSLIATASGRSELMAIAFGAMLGLPLYLYAPGFDLLLSGLIGGTLAHFIAKRRGWE